MCRYIVTESLNTDMVKAENPEAVVATEPQGKHICTSLFTSIVIHLLLQKPKYKTAYYSRKQNSKCLNVVLAGASLENAFVLDGSYQTVVISVGEREHLLIIGFERQNGGMQLTEPGWWK